MCLKQITPFPFGLCREKITNWRPPPSSMTPSVFYGDFFLVSREIKQTCTVSFLPSAWPTRQTSSSKQRTSLSPRPRLPGRRRRRPGGDVPCLILRTPRSLSSAPPTRWVRPRHARWLSFLRCVQAPEVQAADSPLTLVRRQLRTKRKWMSVCVWPEVPTSVPWFQLSHLHIECMTSACLSSGPNSVPLVILTQWIYTYFLLCNFFFFLQRKFEGQLIFPGKKFCFWRCL